MLKVVFRKMMAKRWMMLALLIGNIMLVGIASGNAMYNKAVLQRTLKRTFQQAMTESGEYPVTVALHVDKGKASIPDFFRLRDINEGIEERFGVPALVKIEYLYLARAAIDMDVKRGDFKSREVILGCLSGLEEHAEFKGKVYSDTPDENGVIDAVLSRAALDDMKLVVGDEITLKKLNGRDGNPIRLRIVGVVERADSSDPYWVISPDDMKSEVFISPVIFKDNFLADTSAGMSRGVGAEWYTLLDYTEIDTDKIDLLSSAVAELETTVGTEKNANIKVNYTKTLSDYTAVSKSISITLMVIQVPVFVLLFAFILMVSKQLMQMEQGEIAVLRSRGASRGEIFSIYLIQSGILAAVGFLIGMPTGVFLCVVLGSTDSFLSFVGRMGMSVGINGTALIYGGAGAIISMLTMVLPSVSYTKNTIVNHKQKKHGKRSASLWQKLCLDIVAIGVSLYALYTMNGQKALLAQKVAEGEPLDPLLFLASSLFMLGAGLFAVRLIPVLVYAVYRPFKKLWSPALYVSFLRVLRERASQGFIIIFLIMTLALGVFNAKAARTINNNAEENLTYTIGADIVLSEKWKDNSGAVEQHTASAFAYTEPDFTRYKSMQHVVSAAKVYRNDSLTAKSKQEKEETQNNGYSQGDNRKTVDGVTLMAINTQDFGNTINMQQGLLPTHINNYLNAMAPDVQALIVSTGFRDVLGYKIGDVLEFYYTDKDSNEYKMDGIIYGFVDYWPGFLPRSYTVGSDGKYTERQNYLVVAHLSRVQANWGTLPYEVWLKTDGESGFITEWANDNNITFTKYSELSEELADTLGAPLIQSANGILTVGFIVVLVLCAVGFLIYWVLSIRARTLQFGIFRAMGMLMREVITMLLNEQLFISGVSIALGTVVGFLTARLYMPLIQLAYTASDQVLPLKVAEAMGDIGNLFGVIGGVMLIGIIILGVIVRRMNITQALKLGED